MCQHLQKLISENKRLGFKYTKEAKGINNLNKISLELIKVIRCNTAHLMFYTPLVIVFLMGIKEELKKNISKHVNQI